MHHCTNANKYINSNWWMEINNYWIWYTFEQRLKVKDKEWTETINDVDEWNRLSLYDFDNVFDDNMNKFIDDKLLPHV